MTALRGIAISDGIGIGNVVCYRPFVPQVGKYFIDKDVNEQLEEFMLLRHKAAAELDALINKKKASNSDQAMIFIAHKDILLDNDIAEEIRNQVHDEIPLDLAIHQIYTKYAELLGSTEDAHIRERAVDLLDVRNRILRLCAGENELDLSDLFFDSVILAYDLLPSDTAKLDMSKIAAIVTELGGQTSHTAIIARGAGIPAVSGIRRLLDQAQEGEQIIVDATEGTIYIAPTPLLMDQYRIKKLAFEKKVAVTKQYLTKDIQTKDGTDVDILVNITGKGNQTAYANYCDGVGLFRTEFLFMGRSSPPAEDEQTAVYSNVLKSFGNKPVVIRTLDIGGDKPVAYLQEIHEENPFLGNRALRLCFENTDIFATQIRALLRASVYGNLWVMFPMVTSIGDIRKAMAFVDEQRALLTRKDIGFSKEIKWGIMIEIPAIAMISDLVAKEVDFASIGSNDLLQYMCAADRMNPAVSEYYQAYHPSFYRLVRYIVKSFHAAGKHIAVCGELGGEPDAASLLVGLGIRALSMSPDRLPYIKQRLVSLTIPQMETAAMAALECPVDTDVYQCAQKLKDGLLN